MSREAIKQFVERLNTDPKLAEWNESRSLDKEVSLSDALDYAVKVGADNGYDFTREELSDVMLEQAPQRKDGEQGEHLADEHLADEQLEEAVGGLSLRALSFSSIRIGLSNPTRVMCQYHAPLSFSKNLNVLRF